MRFTVNLDGRKFAALMRGKSDFIDVQVKDGKAHFLVYDVGMMVGCSVSLVMWEDYEDCFFRVPTKLFLGFLAEESVEFAVSEFGVSFMFLKKKGDEHYKFETKKQIVSFERFEKLWELQRKLQSGEYRKLQMAGLNEFVRMAYHVGGVVSSDASVLYCATHSVQLYQATDLPSPAISIYAKDLYMMTRQCDWICSIGNAVVTAFDDFVIVVDKVRQTMTSDYRFLAEKRSKRRFTVTLSNALAAIKKVNYGQADAEVNFTKQYCRLEMENCTLTVPIAVESQEMVKADASLDDLFKQLEDAPREVKIFLTRAQSGLLYGFKRSMSFSVFANFVKVELAPRMFLIISRSD